MKHVSNEWNQWHIRCKKKYFKIWTTYDSCISPQNKTTLGISHSVQSNKKQHVATTTKNGRCDCTTWDDIIKYNYTFKTIWSKFHNFESLTFLIIATCLVISISFWIQSLPKKINSCGKQMQIKETTHGLSPTVVAWRRRIWRGRIWRGRIWRGRIGRGRIGRGRGKTRVCWIIVRGPTTSTRSPRVLTNLTATCVVCFIHAIPILYCRICKLPAEH